MGAPTPAARQTPSGTKMPNGYQTEVAFSAAPAVALWERDITPPSLEGGDPIDTSTQFNTTYLTKYPGSLVDMGMFSMVCGYDPVAYSTLLSLINVNTTVTVHFPNGDSLAFYGYLKSFKPGPLSRGKMPEATVEVVPTNSDPSDCTEQPPTYTAGSGTAC